MPSEELRYFAMELVKLYETGYVKKVQEFLISQFVAGIRNIYIRREEKAKEVSDDEEILANQQDVCRATEHKTVDDGSEIQKFNDEIHEFGTNLWTNVNTHKQ
ncbi:hypothetical protein RF11_15893 [Thelohanellus kitauei]|uniref:Uncharacterized protein n=1 Tax=Thelohanellus kitauei TaxID=669202 RepID=A0A0C2M0M5_THEKT|nr:hypothetical protein RF11_16335 [Thelohanellus kitauei]KII68666.1 hypothetical protein RF11_15893 [Thelohanellus kitauei]